MDRYRLFLNRTVNSLAYFYMRGRNQILWLQSLLSPLNRSNSDFIEFVIEKNVEVNVTSQVIHFEWFLNRKFRGYFQDSTDSVKIFQNQGLGFPIYKVENNLAPKENILWELTDDLTGISDDLLPKSVYFRDESVSSIDKSFKVSVPAIDTNIISVDDFNNLIMAEIDRYKLAGKTYDIINNQ